MKFEWDTHKNQLNQAKHKVSFELAARVFADPNRIEVYDEDHSDDEDRWITIGIVRHESFGAMLVVVYTERYNEEYGENAIRLISARKAHEHEKNSYYNV